MVSRSITTATTTTAGYDRSTFNRGGITGAVSPSQRITMTPQIAHFNSHSNSNSQTAVSSSSLLHKNGVMHHQSHSRGLHHHHHHHQQQKRRFNMSSGGESELVDTIRNSPLLIIIIINMLVFLLYQLIFANSKEGRRWFRANTMTSLSTLNHLHALLLANFTHVDPIHLLVNMFVLFNFGNTMLTVLGRTRFVQIYLIAGVISSISFLAEKFIRTQMAPDQRQRIIQKMQACCGASGSISALLTMFCLMFPYAEVRLMFFIPLRTTYVLYGGLLVELCRLFFFQNSNVAASAHLGGSLAGAIFFAMLKRGRW